VNVNLRARLSSGFGAIALSNGLLPSGEIIAFFSVPSANRVLNRDVNGA